MILIFTAPTEKYGDSFSVACEASNVRRTPSTYAHRSTVGTNILLREKVPSGSCMYYLLEQESCSMLCLLSSHVAVCFVYRRTTSAHPVSGVILYPRQMPEVQMMWSQAVRQREQVSLPVPTNEKQNRCGFGTWYITYVVDTPKVSIQYQYQYQYQYQRKTCKKYGDASYGDQGRNKCVRYGIIHRKCDISTHGTFDAIRNTYCS